MSPEKVSGPGAGAPLDSLSGAGPTPDVEPKNEPSAFDKVMDKQDDSSHDRGDSRPDGKDSRVKDKEAKSPDKEMPLQDLSQFLRFRTQTMERPSGMEELKVDKALPRQVIDEVVQAVRVGVNKAGDKEMQFDLKSNVMDGLSIRVSIHDNKVVTILEASTLDVKHRLEAGMGELMHNLEQRGLPAAEVEVKFREEPRRQQDQSSRQQRQYQGQPDEDEDEQ
jgi:hypothetical protein